MSTEKEPESPAPHPLSSGYGQEIMRKTLTDLRQVDTNEELRRLTLKHQLTVRAIASLCMVGYDTVTSWRSKPTSTRFRRMPNRSLELLKSKLLEK